MNEIPIAEGYSEPHVGRWAMQLDDQLRRLKAALEDAQPDLEWLPRPGSNSIGMLLAHLAIVEVWWFLIVPRGVRSREEDSAACQEILGIRLEDDGIPAEEGTGHPEVLRGKTLAEYFELLDRARTAVHRELRTWKDADLDETFELKGDDFTFAWALYHVLEHFAAHFGQIGLLTALQRSE